MRLSRSDADVFVPSGEPLGSALRRCAVLGVAAHPDDLECMALAPIARCLGRKAQAFAGVVAASGAGGLPVRGLTPSGKARLRRGEQRKAAVVGEYAFVVQLGHPSAELRDPSARGPVDDLETVFKAARPREVYTHDLADGHPTHVATALRVVAALRRLPAGRRPARLVGLEVWRGLDWMGEGRVAEPVEAPPGLGEALIGVFSSQLADKRYDLAVRGRRLANATFAHRAARDGAGEVSLGMDLTPLLRDDGLAPEALAARYLGAFQKGVLERLERLGRRPGKGGRR